VQFPQCSGSEQGFAPTLLGRPALRRDLWQNSDLWGDEAQRLVKVKNTFIDGFADEDEDIDLPAMTGCKSWHVGCWVKRSELEPMMRMSSQESVSTSSDQDTTTYPHTSSSALSVAPASSGQYVSDLDGSAVPEPPSAEGFRRPEASRGAALHGSGQCRPCGWFWKPEGCSHGADCGHCHMCLAGELKARKKAKAQVLRGARSDRRANTTTVDEPPAAGSTTGSVAGVRFNRRAKTMR
jgi:hypothetical protein